MGRAVKIASGIGASAVLGYLGYYFNERRTEQPRYRVIDSDGRFEVREYPSLLTASTTGFGERERALRSGFRSLASYIFAKSRSGEKIAMTAPVLQDRTGGDEWRTRFVMPAEYDRTTLPAAPGGVQIERIEPRKVAAVTFNGGQNDARLAARTDELREWLAQRGLTPCAEPEYAFYNSPFIVPPLRRNEVLIPVE